MKADALAAASPIGNTHVVRDTAGAIQTARYIEDMVIGLRKLAQMHEEAVLAMLLEMAALEAARIAKEGDLDQQPARPAPLRVRD